MSYYVYFARCADGSLYAGSCIDLSGREAKHNEGRGAKYTRSRLPVRFVYSESFPTKSGALRREAALKKLTKSAKEALVAGKSS